MADQYTKFEAKVYMFTHYEDMKMQHVAVWVVMGHPSYSELFVKSRQF